MRTPRASNWLNAPVLTGRLVGLREPRREDVEVLFSLSVDPEHVSLTDERPFQPRSLAALQAGYDKQQNEPDPRFASFTIQRLDDDAGTAIGAVGLWNIDSYNRTAHIGISLLPSLRGQGLGRDALDVICRFAFHFRALHRVSLETLEVNTAMQAAAASCGFVQEGRLRSSAWHLGRRVDEVLYGLLAHDWSARQP